MNKLTNFLAWGGIKKDIILLIISGIALIYSIFDLIPLPFDAAWVAIISLWYSYYPGSVNWACHSF